MIFSLSGGGSAMTAYAATQGYTALATALESGGQYIVTNADGTKAMSDATSSDGLAGVDITMNADKTTVSTEDAGGLEAFIWTSDDGKTLTLNDKKLKIATTVTASSYDSSQLEITADGGLKCTANGYYLLYENTAFSTGFSSGNVKVYKISMCAHENKIDEQHKDATCTEDGYDKFHCNDCDQDIETVIPATGHIFGEDHVCTVCGVFQATVGTGTSGYYYTPMHYGKYALTETIYPASELGAKSGKITSIAYQVYSSNVTQETTDFKIYMKHTAAGSFSSSTSYDLDDLTLVYSGTPILGGAKGSWNTFTLDTPFDYNGTDNLIVVIAKKATAAGTYPQLYYYYTNTPNSSLYRYDNSDESYADVANTTASNAYSSMYYRANIRVEMKLCDHDWVKGETVPPSCTEQGYTEYECQKCQSTKKDDIISATGHSRPSSGVEHKDAACTEDGYDKYECTTCHKPVTEVIPATGHDFEDNICKACGVYQVTVGEGVLTTYVSPMNTYVKNSLTETIYSAEEIGKAGSIESIAYHIAGAGTLETSSLKIYMKHTDADTFSSTSFDLEDLTLVYEGTPTIGGLKDEWETYQLDTPFKYNGTDNLIVAVSRISAVTGSTPTYYYTMASNTNLRRGNATNSDYAGITNNATGTRGSYKANIRLEMKTTGDTPTPSTYTVTFMNGNTEYAKEEVTAGGKVTTTVIDTPPVRQSEAQYYDFAGWSSDGGRTVLTAAQVKENVVNAAVTYEAVFTPKEFSVEKDEKQAAGDAETAFYNTDYTGHIAGYAADHDYSVTYTVGDGEAREVTVGTDGSFTIPGASITGNLTIAITDDTQAAEPPMDQMKTYYIISTPEQLAWYAAQTETAGYAVGAYLDADIDMSSYDWNPMGGNSAGNGYKGTFDGNGNTITIDMSQTDSAPNNSGLFDFIAKGGVVKNVVLAGSVKGGAYVGGIASQNYGTIQNCINKASVAAEASNTVMAGGIVGNNYATIENCANQGAIDAKSTTGTMSTIHAGGIAGKLSLSPNTDPQNSCSISKCYNTGSVSAASSTTLYLSNTYVGGIAGYYGTPSNANKVSIEDCYSTGTLNAEGVSAGNKYIGGIVGAGYASKDDDSKDYERVTLNRCWYLSGTAEKTINGAVTSGPSDNPCCVETNTGAKTASELKSTSFFTQIEGYKSDSRTNPINGGYPVLQWQTTEGGEDPEPQPAAVWDGTLDFSWYNEDDVQTDYYISTPAQWEALAWICSEHLDKLKDEATYKSYTNGNITNIIGTVPTKQNTFAGVTFYLEKDIDMGGVYDEASGTWSGKNYYPIGSQAADDAGTGNFYGEFYGSFDGQGHTVKNVYCDRGTGQNAQAVGLFGRVGERDKDKGDTSPYTEVSGDIVIENVAVTGYIKSGRSVGGIVGKTLHVSDGHKIVIRNCVNYADVTSTDSKGVGGIAGALWNSAEIESCINFGDVTFSYSKACAGGIAGDNDGKNVVRKSINFGTIHFTGSGQRAAGTIIGNDNSKPEQADNC